MNQKEYLELHEEICEEAARPTTWPEHMQPDERPKLDSLFKDLTVFVPSPFESKTIGARLVAEAARLAGHVTEEQVRMFGARGRELSLRKNKDYADPEKSTDPRFAIFKNFLRCEQLGICKVEAGFLVRLSDKVSRCETLMSREEGPAVTDEKLEDTLLDIVNYTCLLLAYLKTSEENQSSSACQGEEAT